MRLFLIIGVFSLPTSALAQSVTVTGCPANGIEVGCIVIKDEDGKTYNITNAKPKPKVGSKAIKLTGTVSDKVSFCNQGTILEEIKYEETSKDCDATGEK
ncbi:MAG: hypothetical protein WAP03_12565 [Methylorubrum rhodinum]|uniref:hypothetical protein n=1 Tax=Methylorubrum rhodinum TaxID=29428 RepID=UPI003BB1B528